MDGDGCPGVLGAGSVACFGAPVLSLLCFITIVRLAII